MEIIPDRLICIKIDEREYSKPLAYMNEHESHLKEVCETFGSHMFTCDATEKPADAITRQLKSVLRL